MTLGNDDTHLQPGNDDHQQPTADTAADLSTSFIDPDDAELTEARAAAQAEEAAGGAEVQPVAPAGTPQPQANAQPQQGQPQAGQQPEPVMIPKPRLDEALSARDKAVSDAAYWRGQAEALTRVAQPTAQAAGVASAPAAQPTPQERLTTIETQIDALAAKFDAGEISAQQWRKEERALNAQADTIKSEMATPARPAPQQQQQPSQGGDALYLDALTAKLEDDHAWVKPFNAVATESEWKFVAEKAKEACLANGIDPTNGSIGTYEFRKEISRQIDKLAPALIADRAQQAQIKGFAFPGSQQPAAPGQQQPKPLSPAAQARTTKLALHQQAPVNINDLSGQQTDGMPTAAAIDAMSDEEISALPPSVRAKLLSSA